MVRTPQYDVIQRLKQKYINIGGTGINFQRTCRVPEGQINSLPAGLGSFPVFKVKDFKEGAPDTWREDGYFMPMYRQEAMWIYLGRGNIPSPKALIIGAGNINAISGKPFDTSLGKDGKEEGNMEIRLQKEQNYVVVPPQPWLDGWKAENGRIYQFVAAEMGSGETVEGQITGKEVAGGIQLIVYDSKQKLVHKATPHEYPVSGSWSGFDIGLETLVDTDSQSGGMEFLSGLFSGGLHLLADVGSAAPETLAKSAIGIRSMGLGRGGEIRQKIYPDPYGVEVWNEKPTAVDIVYLVSSEDFKQVTGYPAPPTPVTFETYMQFGLPWFELHDTNYADTPGSDIFSKLKPVGEGKAK